MLAEDRTGDLFEMALLEEGGVGDGTCDDATLCSQIKHEWCAEAVPDRSVLCRLSAVRRLDGIEPLWEGLHRGGERPGTPSHPVAVLWQVLEVRSKQIVWSEHNESARGKVVFKQLVIDVYRPKDVREEQENFLVWSGR